MNTPLESTNPSTGALVGSVPVTPVESIPPIIDRARAALASWTERTPAQRADLLATSAEIILSRADEIGRQLSLEMGKPLGDAISEVRGTARGFTRDVAEMAEALAPEELVVGRTHSTIIHDALGVCASITPWNFPFMMPHWMVVPALVAGNTVILKPSEETPLTGQSYVDCLNEVLPKDVLQVIHGADEQGKALVAGDIDLVAFTGSRAVGKSIMQACAPRLKRAILELGGKDPMVILDDADLEAAAQFATRNSFRNAGQVCVSTERIIIQQSIIPDFLELLVEQASQLSVGDGLDPATDVGPLVNAKQKQHVVSQIEDALERGASLVLGGPQGEGNFLSPTILTNVEPSWDIAKEETFGPVVCVISANTDEDLVALANDTPFGLGATVFGSDPVRTERIAGQLKAGMIGINKGCGGASGTPWVGARESGYGFHGSRDGHRQFAQTRVISKTLQSKE